MLLRLKIEGSNSTDISAGEFIDEIDRWDLVVNFE